MKSIDQIRTIAWFHDVCSEAEVKSAYALTQRFDELSLESNQASAMRREESKSFAPYAAGKVVPSIQTLEEVEKVFPSTKRVYDLGPRSDSGYPPLWLALGGSEEALRAVLVWYDESLGIPQAAGASLWHLIDLVTQRFMPHEYVMQNMLPAAQAVGDHLLVRAYEAEILPINLDDVAVLVALWRLSMHFNEDFPYMNYFMTGLYPKVIPDLLGPYGIDTLFVTYCQLFAAQHMHQIEQLSQGLLADKPVLRK